MGKKGINNATIKSRKSDIKSTIELLEKIVQEGEITDANIRMLVNKIVVSEQNGMISIQIKLNAKFTNHILTCNEDGLDINIKIYFEDKEFKSFKNETEYLSSCHHFFGIDYNIDFKY